MSATAPRLAPLWRITPVTTSLALASRVVARNLRVYRRGWMYLLSGFVEPFLYLLSVGVGLGHLVGGLQVGGRAVTYAQFVAPGLLAAQAMNGAIFDTTYNLFYKLKYAHTYEAVLATPVGTNEVALGEIGWALARGTTYGAAFLGVMAGLGLVLSPWGVLCLPVVALVSFAFAATGMAVTSFMRSWQDVDSVALALLPLFLFSGTFYPLGVYPSAVAWLVRVTPLYQGVDVLRAFSTGTPSWSVCWHLAYLLALAGLALAITSRRLRRLLAP
ncbi:MAG: transporter [Acidimicrobiaceae bacterium]|nr:transporter [Acidimicrobiaceae bacterium]